MLSREGKRKAEKVVGGRARKVVKVKGNPLQLLVMTHSQMQLLVVTHSWIQQRVLPRRPKAQVKVWRAQGEVTNSHPQGVPTDVALEEVKWIPSRLFVVLITVLLSVLLLSLSSVTWFNFKADCSGLWEWLKLLLLEWLLVQLVVRLRFLS